MWKVLARDALTTHVDFAESSAGKSLADMPLGFIDIGARGGTHDLVEPVAAQTAVLGFEPDPPECARLLAMPEVTSPWARFELEAVALADREGEATLHLLSAATNHSLLPPNTGFTSRYRMVKWELAGTEKMPTTTLDKVLFSHGREAEGWWGEFLKIDTQGTEYEILQGALRTLKERTVAVVAEVSFAELYKGQKLFSEVEQLMRAQGFTFYGFSNGPHTRSKKLLDKQEAATAERIMYADAVFFKDPLPGTWHTGGALQQRQVFVLFSIALLLHYYDFALELAEATWLKTADDAEGKRVRRLVASLAALPREGTAQSVRDLAQQVQQRPELANVIVGNFVDKRRRLCNYDDVLNVSPLPKTV